MFACLEMYCWLIDWLIEILNLIISEVYYKTSWREEGGGEGAKNFLTAEAVKTIKAS